ncbi:MAG: peptidoglycan DD-metalloendopeptidase family protein [Rikenellaceae bacterium]
MNKLAAIGWGSATFLIRVFVVVFTTAQLSYAQSLETLNSQREEAEKEIVRIDKELEELKSSSTDLQKQLTLCSKRLAERKKVLNSIGSQMALLNKKEKSQSEQATLHSQSLSAMQETFRISSRELYRAQLLKEGSELFLSDSLQSLHTHSSHITELLLKEIKTLSDSISQMQGELGIELREIAARKIELQKLQNDASEALKEIETEQRQIKTLEQKLGGKTQQLSAQREAKLKALSELQRQIAEVIRQESASKRDGDANSKLYTINSQDFAGSKGKMPSPMIGARITDSYGLHNHPTLSGVKIDNKGVNITGGAGQGVRVIASGEVRKVFMVPGMGASVLVRHGEYLTVYSNLKAVSVSVGSTVSAGEFIGEVGDDGMLHFEIWKETTTLNPTQWVNF